MGRGGSVGMMEVGEGVAVDSGVAGGTLYAGDAVAGADGGGDGDGCRGVSGDTGDVALGPDTGTTVAFID